MTKNILVVSAVALAFALTCCTQIGEPEVLELDNPATINSQLPFLSTDNTGQLYFSWVEPGNSEIEYRLLYSKLMENGWTDPSEIQKSEEWFVNWADFPSVVAHNGNAMAAHQLRKIPGNTYSYEIDITTRTNDEWNTPFTLHKDSTATEHGFVSMTALNDELFMAVWLDGRQTEDRSDEEYFNMDKAMSLRSAIINTDGSVNERLLIDDTVCDCCPTSMVMTTNGPVAAYRDRTDEEIRDIFVTRYIDGNWTSPTAVHNDSWKIGACPVNGPKLSARGSNVGIAWYTAADGESAVKVAYSSDSGETFGDPVIINKRSTVGRVDIAMDETGQAYVSEINKRGEQHYLTVHKVNFNTTEYESYEVAPINGSRSSGFPQMEMRNEELILAWTDIAEDKTTRLKTVRLNNL